MSVQDGVDPASLVEPGAAYAMAGGPDGLLGGLFQPAFDELGPALRDEDASP